MYVLCTLTVYFMGGQLVFDWDLQENLLATRDWPVGNKVTNAKCQSWVSYVTNTVQPTIACVSDAQAEGKVSVSHKSWLRRNNRKTYNSTFTVSAELDCGQPSQDAPKNMPDQRQSKQMTGFG